MAKASDFYVGIVDFFAVLLPGAIAIGLLLARLDDDLIQSVIAVPTGELGQWLAFLFASYFVGRIVFLLGAFLDGPCELIRKWRLEQGSKTAVENDDLYFAVQVLKIKLFSDDAITVPKNNFQWARAVLLHESPGAIAEVNRIEANSKFFRSLTVISFIAIFSVGINTNDYIGLVLILVTCVFFMRYYERRLKSNTLAYLHLITMTRLNELKDSK